jgi:hypothetical protein
VLVRKKRLSCIEFLCHLKQSNIDAVCSVLFREGGYVLLMTIQLQTVTEADISCHSHVTFSNCSMGHNYKCNKYKA